MKPFLAITLLSLSLSANVFSQELSREQKIQSLTDLSAKMRTIEEDILKPNLEDVRKANAKGLAAIRLIPRGKFAEHTFDRGGGAYYSFSTNSHSYNKMPQIALQNDSLSVGFYGLNYGLMIDLGAVPVENLSTDQPELAFLAAYAPPNLIPEIRAEQNKRGNYTANAFVYSSHLRVVVGNTYALRSIGYDEADILVAFHILRKDDDGSLVIGWKKLKDFEIPRPWYFTDSEMTEKLTAILGLEQFSGIAGKVRDNVISLTGSASQRNIRELERQLHVLRAVKIDKNITVVDQK